MIEQQFNIFDGVVIGVMALSCLFAFFRGLVKEILSLAAWVGAGLIAIYYYPAAFEKLQPQFKNPLVAACFAGFGVYVVALMGLSIINIFIMKTIRSGGEAGMLDNLLGLMFGAIRGALIISLGFFLLTIAMPGKEYPEWVAESITHPYAERGAVMLAKAAPEYLQKVSVLTKKMADRTEDEKAFWRQQPQRPQAELDPAAGEAPAGYNRSAQQQLERLIENK